MAPGFSSASFPVSAASGERMIRIQRPYELPSSVYEIDVDAGIEKAFEGVCIFTGGILPGPQPEWARQPRTRFYEALYHPRGLTRQTAATTAGVGAFEKKAQRGQNRCGVQSRRVHYPRTRPRPRQVGLKVKRRSPLTVTLAHRLRLDRRDVEDAEGAASDRSGPLCPALTSGWIHRNRAVAAPS
jgi:hypothetical protein